VTDWIVVGRLLKTRGRIGEFIADVEADRAERLQTVLLRKPSQERPSEVSNVWFHSGRPILAFTGIGSISAAEPWEHAEILVPAEERAVAEEGAYLHQDLIGCTVEDHSGPLGLVQAIDEFGGPPVLRLSTPAGKELLIPFVKAMCTEIDIPGKRIRMQLPEGLTDL
jgi:16S rRNA processing protein RimM